MMRSPGVAAMPPNVPAGWGPPPQLPDATVRGPNGLQWTLAVAVLVNVWRWHDLVPGLARLRLPLLSLAAATLLFWLYPDPLRRILTAKSRLLTLAMVLLGLAMASIPTSLWPGGSVRFMYKDFLPTMWTMVMIAASIRTIRDVEFFLKVNAVGAVVCSAFVIMLFEVQSSGRLGKLVYYDANDLALLIAVTLPSLLYFARPGVTSIARFFAAVGLVVFFLTLIKTGSRGGFLALLAVLGYVVVFYRAIPTRQRLMVTIGGLALLVVLGGPAFWSRMSGMLRLHEDYNWAGGAYEGRLEIWKRAMGYIARRPVLGLGVRSFDDAEGRLSEVARRRQERSLTTKWSVAHNSFIELAAEIGIPGLVVFLALGITAFRTLGRIQRTRAPPPPGATAEQTSALAQLFCAALIGYAVAGFFLSAQYFMYLYVVLAMIIGLGKVTNWGRPPLSPSPLPDARVRHPWNRVTVGAGAR